MTTACANRIAAEVPAYDGHEIFLGAARVLLGENEHARERFERMPEMAGISHRYSCIVGTDRVYLHDERRLI